MDKGEEFNDSETMVITETPNSVGEESPSLLELMLMELSSESIEHQIKLPEGLPPPPLGLKYETNVVIDSQQSHTLPNKKRKQRHPTTAAADKDLKNLTKATRCDATLLKIGSWKRVAKYNEDLVVKFYFGKRKLVWEILERGLKKKIEVSWDSILAMRVSTEENQPGILEVELNRVPSFYEEKEPQPRMQTIWSETSDFTHDQASICRRHYIQFAPGVFDRYYERLLRCESRFVTMRECTFPSQQSPYFHPSFQYNITSIDEKEQEFTPPVQVYQQPIQVYEPHLLLQVSDIVLDDEFMRNIDEAIKEIDMECWYNINIPQWGKTNYGDHHQVAEENDVNNPITQIPSYQNCDINNGNHFFSYYNAENYNGHIGATSSSQNITTHRQTSSPSSSVMDTELWSFTTLESTGAEDPKSCSTSEIISKHMWDYPYYSRA